MARKKSNVKKPKAIEMQLDKKRKFILDLNAYCELDFLYDDKDFNDILADFIEGRPYAIRAFIWAGLVHEDEDLTVKDVGKYVKPGEMNELTEQILKGLSSTLPEDEGEEKN